LQLELSLIKGTGKQGRILKEDVLKYLKSKDVPSFKQQSIIPVKDDTIPLTNIQKVMVKTMTEAMVRNSCIIFFILLFIFL